MSLSERVSEFSRIITEATASKDPAAWEKLAGLVDTAAFRRVGIWREHMDWQEYVDFLSRFAARKSFDSKVTRVTETADVVYYEIEERHTRDGRTNVVNSINVFAFGPDGRIRSLDVYVQGQVEPSVPLDTLRIPDRAV